MAEKQDLKISPAGIWSAPSAVEAPNGALLVGSEIVLRRPGLAEPRPGFSRLTDLGSEPSIMRLLPFQDDYLRVNTTGPLTEWSGGADLKTEAAAHLSWLDDAIFSEVARKNLYLTTSDVLRKACNKNDATAFQTGAPVPMIAGSPGSNGQAINISSYVGYRVLTRRTDANGLVVRSGVSGRTIIHNTSTTNAKQGSLLVVLNPEDDFRVGDVIEIYRSFNALVIPVPEEYLLAEIAVTSSVLSAGSATYTDNVLDVDLGAALYTNESRGGISQNHVRPPAVTYAELFNGSLFLSDLKFPAEITIAWMGVVATSSSTAVGSRVFTGDFTNGSADIANVTPTTGLQIGQIIGNAASEWAVNTQYVRITNIVGSTVTMSTTFTGTTGNKSRTFYDSIKIGSLYFPAFDPQFFVASSRGYDVTVNPGGHSPADDVAASWIGDYRAVGVDEKQQVVITAVKPSVTPFTIQATHGDQYDPALPLPTASALTVSQETQPGGIMWSNNLEPEHFTLDNIDIIGDADTRCMALEAMKNALLVFKTDGIWRVSGAGAETGFRFDSLDPQARLLYSAATASAGDKVYAWCDLGIYECDENGCLDISNPALRNLLEPIQHVVGPGSRTAHGVWACSNRKEKEVLFSAPLVTNTNEGERLYVFNRETGTWVNWLIGGELKHAAYRYSVSGGGVVPLLVIDDQYVRQEKLVSISLDESTTDTEFSINISSVAGAVVTIDGGSGWTPAVGDLVKKAGYWLVTAVTDATHFTVHTTGLGTGGGSAYVSYSSVIAFIAATARHPGLLKSWGEGALWWEDLYGMHQYTLGFTSALSTSAESQAQVVSNGRITDHNGDAMRFVTPRNHALTTRLFPTVTIRQAGSRWKLSALGLGYRFMSDRVRTK